MISHALTIVANELEGHLTDAYQLAPASAKVSLGNLSEGLNGAADSAGVPRDVLCLSLVNVQEEKSLKNLPNRFRDDVNLTVVYQNPPVFLNCQILVTATHKIYTNGLLMLSRAIRFFQFRKVFTQDNVAPGSLTTNQPSNALDQLDTFKLIFDLYSPNMEEINHLWGTLGGKQYPFALYTLRLMELQFRAVQAEGVPVTQVRGNFRHLGEGS